MENQVRELLRDIAEDIPPQRQVPPALRPRARRHIAASVGLSLVVVGALALGGLVAVRSITGSSPVPADPGPTTGPTPLGAGEVLTGKGDLIAQDPESGQVRTIVDAEVLPEREDTPKSITGAAWSFDRRWVAFRANGLFVADTVGGAPQQLTADQGWFPWAWSPTEDQLAVVDDHDVTLIDAATGRETDLGTVVGPEDGEGIAVHNLVWSPDGTRLAYDAGPGWGSVYLVDVASGEHSMLVPQPAGTGEIEDIDWSPDGAHLAISYDGSALYLANADGSDVRLVDRIDASKWGVWHPGLSAGTAWSPDGTRLAFTSVAGPDRRELQVWTVSVDGSAPSLVASRCCLSDDTSIRLENVDSVMGGPVWSPDGLHIAFVTDEGGPLPHHLVVNADGTSEQREIDELTYLSWLGGWYFCYCYG